MNHRAEAIIRGLVVREGGYVDHPADRGGPTKYGITQETLAGWRGHPVTAADVAALSVEEASEIYADRYVRPLARLEFIPDVFALMVDIAVMSGVATAIRLLQSTLNSMTTLDVLAVDGILGQKTVMAVVRMAPGRVVQAMVKARVLMLARMVERDPSQSVFLVGWLNRTLAFLPEAA